MPLSVDRYRALLWLSRIVKISSWKVVCCSVRRYLFDRLILNVLMMSRERIDEKCTFIAFYRVFILLIFSTITIIFNHWIASSVYFFFAAVFFSWIGIFYFVDFFFLNRHRFAWNTTNLVHIMNLPHCGM